MNIDKISNELIQAEILALENDKELYLECMNNFLLRDRKSPLDIRDGLILFHSVYRVIRPAVEPIKKRKPKKNYDNRN